MSEIPLPNFHTPKGIHYLLECSGIDISILINKVQLENILRQAATEAGATIVESTIHQFNPYGLSGVIVIAESHIAIHTWPEHHYAAIDIFTCGDALIAEKIYQNLIQLLTPTKHIHRVITRQPPT